MRLDHSLAWGLVCWAILHEHGGESNGPSSWRAPGHPGMMRSVQGQPLVCLLEPPGPSDDRGSEPINSSPFRESFFRLEMPTLPLQGQ